MGSLSSSDSYTYWDSSSESVGIGYAKKAVEDIRFIKIHSIVANRRLLIRSFIF